MAFAKRIFLFLLTNILIIATISIVLSLLGVTGYMEHGAGRGYYINYESLFVICAVWGFAGSMMSLLLSKVVAKFSMGVRVIDPNKASSGETQFLLQTVHKLARATGISTMPEVGIYESPDVNAFATGPTKNRALVAVSSGLLRSMNRDEIEGVLSHEVAHIANGDMVTMTLIQGVVNTFVMFFARVLAFAATSAMSRNDNERPSYFMQSMLVFLFEIIFGLLGMVVVGYYSRVREYRADKGGAQLAGRGKMIAALEALRRVSGAALASDEDGAAVATLKISSGKRGGFVHLFSTHPPLEQRINALMKMR